MWKKSELLEVRSSHVQVSKEASGTQPAKADWSRNYFAFAILLNTISISREIFEFSIMLISYKFLGKNLEKCWLTFKTESPKWLCTHSIVKSSKPIMVGLSGSIIFCQKQQVHCADVKMAKGVPFGRESKSSTHECSVRPKPLFWFRFDTKTETQIGGYFRPIP